MESTTQGSAPLSKSRGTPGAAVRSRGFSQALSPFLSMVFAAGWVFGAVVSPSFMQGAHAGLLLILLAIGLYVTWRRAVNLMMRHEEGARGEEKVARVLEGLPDGWRIFHGVELGERKTDHVLVGPDHLYTIETVNWPGQVGLVNSKLVHGGKVYPGYDLESLSRRCQNVAEELGVPEDAVSPMVCVVGGRFGEKAGEKEGVWVGEIQDLGTYLMQPYGNPLDRTVRVSVIEALEAKLEGVGHMSRALVLLAPGCEEMEAVITIDVLRRGGVEVVTAGLQAGVLTASRDVRLLPDVALDELSDAKSFDVVVLPGGLPGTEALRSDLRVRDLLVHYFGAEGKTVATICAAALVLEEYGFLEGRTFTSYPTTREKIAGGTWVDEPVVIDRDLVTSQGPATAMVFALTLVEGLEGREARETVAAGLLA